MKKPRGIACLLVVCLCGLLAGCAPQEANSTFREMPPESEGASNKIEEATDSHDEFTVYLPEKQDSAAEGSTAEEIYFIDKPSSEFPARIPGTLYRYSEGSFTPLLDDVYSICGRDGEYLFLVRRDYEADPIGEWFYGVLYKAHVVAYNLENGAVQSLIGDVDDALYIDNHIILFTRVSEKEDGGFQATLYTQEGTGVAPTQLLSVDIFDQFAHCILYKEDGYAYFEYFFDARCVRLSLTGEILADSIQVPVGAGYNVQTEGTSKWRDFVFNCGSYSVCGSYDPTLDNTTILQTSGKQTKLDMDPSMPFTSPGNGLFYYFSSNAGEHQPMVYNGTESQNLALGYGRFIYRGNRLFFVEEEYLEGEALYEDGEAGARDRVTLCEITGTMDDSNANGKLCQSTTNIYPAHNNKCDRLPMRFWRICCVRNDKSCTECGAEHPYRRNQLHRHPRPAGGMVLTN